MTNDHLHSRAAMFITAAILTIAVPVSALAADVTPHIFLSPSDSSVEPGQSVEIEVFIEEVIGLRLFEIVLEVDGGVRGSLHLTAVTVDEFRPDFVFAGISNLICLPDPNNWRITCTPLSGECVDVDGAPAYMGTYTLTATIDAAGTFNAAILDEPTTFLRDCESEPITPLTFTDATVVMIIAGDLDGDGDVDLDDHAVFVGCVTGPGGGVDAGCEGADVDSDEDVDLLDWGHLQRLFTGGPQ